MPQKKPNHVPLKLDVSKLLQQAWQEAKRWLGILSVKIGDVPANHLAIGKHFMAQGNMHDAVHRFRMVLWLRPAHGEALVLLTQAYTAMSEFVKAEATLAKLRKLKPSHTAISALAQAIQQAKMPPQAKPPAPPSPAAEPQPTPQVPPSA